MCLHVGFGYKVDATVIMDLIQNVIWFAMYQKKFYLAGFLSAVDYKVIDG